MTSCLTPYTKLKKTKDITFYYIWCLAYNIFKHLCWFGEIFSHKSVANVLSLMWWTVIITKSLWLVFECSWKLSPVLVIQKENSQIDATFNIILWPNNEAKIKMIIFWLALRDFSSLWKAAIAAGLLWLPCCNAFSIRTHHSDISINPECN